LHVVSCNGFDSGDVVSGGKIATQNIPTATIKRIRATNKLTDHSKPFLIIITFNKFLWKIVNRK